MMDKVIQDATVGTAGWFAFAPGTVGLCAGQTLRLRALQTRGHFCTQFTLQGRFGDRTCNK